MAEPDIVKAVEWLKRVLGERRVIGKETILQIVPAPAGWRAVNSYLRAEGDVGELSDEELLYVTPVACFALVEDDEERNRYVMCVGPDDWPSYPYLLETRVGILAPGEEIDDFYRVEAREQIEKYRADHCG